MWSSDLFFCIQLLPAFFIVQDFQGPGFSESRFFRVQVLVPGFRSSRPEVFCKKGVLRNFKKFTEKRLCQSLLPSTLLKKRLQHRCFPVNFVKFLRTAFFIEHLWWLLLELGGLEKKELCYRCFPENIFKFFWTAILYSCSRQGMQRCH